MIEAGVGVAERRFIIAGAAAEHREAIIPTLVDKRDIVDRVGEGEGEENEKGGEGEEDEKRGKGGED